MLLRPHPTFSQTRGLQWRTASRRFPASVWTLAHSTVRVGLMPSSLPVRRPACITVYRIIQLSSRFRPQHRCGREGGPFGDTQRFFRFSVVIILYLSGFDKGVFEIVSPCANSPLQSPKNHSTIRGGNCPAAGAPAREIEIKKGKEATP